MVATSNAGLGDELAKSFFQKKVDELHTAALKCKPLEADPKLGITVNEWVKLQPTLPEWQLLASLEETANQARSFAQSVSENDKIRHCVAGCFIAKKLDYKSAALVGWLKELQDSSDCSKNTHFEIKDYDATVIGAKAAKNKDCDKFCKNKSRF